MDVLVGVGDEGEGQLVLAGERVLAPCEVGEITIRAPQLMTGYWQNPTETANVIRVGGVLPFALRMTT